MHGFGDKSNVTESGLNCIRAIPILQGHNLRSCLYQQISVVRKGRFDCLMISPISQLFIAYFLHECVYSQLADVPVSQI